MFRDILVDSFFHLLFLGTKYFYRTATPKMMPCVITNLCSHCLKYSIDIVGSCKASATIATFLGGDVKFEETLAEPKFHMLDFYYSADYDEWVWTPVRTGSMAD